MSKVRACETKIHLSEFLKHGVPVANLQPVDPWKKTPSRELIGRLQEIRGGHRLKGLLIRDLIETDRR